MRYIVLILTALIASTSLAQARNTDSRLGAVVAIERTIENIFNRCLAAVDKPTDVSQYFYSCSFSYTSLGELPITQGRAFSYSQQNCKVDAEHANGKIFITFATDKNKSTFVESKECLAKSIENNRSIRTIIYTIQ